MQRLITILAVLAGCGLVALGVYFVVLGPDAALAQPSVAPVAAGDQEIAWLHPATSATTWERFVAGVKEIPGIECDDRFAFPEDSMKLPAIGLSRKGQPGTLWIRWYKLTGLRTTALWVNELCHRRPPPLAVVGGGNSERARDLAIHLAGYRKQAQLDEASSPPTPPKAEPKLPVLLITTATADQVHHPVLGEVDLMHIYADRSFRFCYTNRQMAEATCDFVREQMGQEAGLQLTSQRISLVSWQDDPFSGDLAKQFEEIWRLPTGTTPHPQVWSHRVAHSVGALNQPNQLETRAIQKLIGETLSESVTLRGRELLVLPGAAPQTRRFLRGLLRSDPNERFFWIVTTGDALDWNSVYRDRRLSWNIEDVPFPLVLFMHRNPVERQLNRDHAFAPETSGAVNARTTGTDDLLLYRDIGSALVKACFRDNLLLSDPDQLIVRLRAEQDEQGFSIFDALGNRQGKGAEYITLVQPLYDGLRILPQSRISVFTRDPATQLWKRIESLHVDYSPQPTLIPSQDRR